MIDLSNFDFSKLIPDDELFGIGIKKWYDSKFTELNIRDYSDRLQIVEVMFCSGVIPYPPYRILPSPVVDEFKFIEVSFSFDPYIPIKTD